MVIDIDGLPVTLIRKRIKHLNLRIHRTGSVRISAPIDWSLDGIYRFLRDKKNWIEHHRERLLLNRPIESSQSLETGDFVFFLGQRVVLELHQGASKNEARLEQTVLHLYIQSGHPAEKTGDVLNHWYRQQMQQHLPMLCEKWENRIGVHAQTYNIRRMETRWGSCHPIKKNITLNLKLIQKPLICLEYVIVHELVHLLEASHNKRFHALMTQFMPDWRQVKKRLEQG